MSREHEQSSEPIVSVSGCPLCAPSFAALDATGTFVLGAQMEALLRLREQDDEALNVRRLLCALHAEGFDRVIDDVRDLVVSELMSLVPVEGAS